MAANTADQQNEMVNDCPNTEADYNFDMHKFDVTLPHDMNLKQFHFNSGGDMSSEDQIFQTDSHNSIDSSDTLKTSDNFLKKFDLFYRDMKSKINLLKNTPVIRSQSDVVSCPEFSNVEGNEKLFKNLKNTPEVQEKLQYIQELDDEIGNIIGDYKNEREQRLQTQKELCNDICKNSSLSGKDTQSFLDMCHFELTVPNENDDIIDDLVDQDIEKILSSTVKPASKDFPRYYPDTFIKRNIELAKTGTLAGSSLTDEEKSRIELLLDTDSKNLNESCDSFTADLDKVSSSTQNAYSMLASEKEKLHDIDGRLEKFTEDEKEKEGFVSSLRDFSDEIIVKQALKKINEQLKELRSTDEKEIERKQLLHSQKMDEIDEEIRKLEEEDEQFLRAENLEKLDGLIKKIKTDACADNPNDSQNETDDEEENYTQDRTFQEYSVDEK